MAERFHREISLEILDRYLCLGVSVNLTAEAGVVIVDTRLGTGRRCALCYGEYTIVICAVKQVGIFTRDSILVSDRKHVEVICYCEVAAGNSCGVYGAVGLCLLFIRRDGCDLIVESRGGEVDNGYSTLNKQALAGLGIIGSRVVGELT